MNLPRTAAAALTLLMTAAATAAAVGTAQAGDGSSDLPVTRLGHKLPLQDALLGPITQQLGGSSILPHIPSAS